jgi:hypothetical protein
VRTLLERVAALFGPTSRPARREGLRCRPRLEDLEARLPPSDALLGTLTTDALTDPRSEKHQLLDAASAAAASAQVVGHVNGGGMGTYDAGHPLAGQATEFGIGVTLYANHTASGHFLCVLTPPQAGDTGLGGGISGTITGWSLDADGTLRLSGTGDMTAVPGGGIFARDVPFSLTIEQPGGPGVGHFTLHDVSIVPSGDAETVATGQIMVRM